MDPSLSRFQKLFGHHASKQRPTTWYRKPMIGVAEMMNLSSSLLHLSLLLLLLLSDAYSRQQICLPKSQ
jgi:hypothetical protein